MKKAEEEREFLQSLKVKTLMREENNMKIFVSDMPDIDFDKLNEEQASKVVNRDDQVAGTGEGVIKKEVNPSEAYKYFRELQSAQFV